MAAKTSKKNSKETAIEKKAEDQAMMSYDFGDEAGAGYDAESSKDIQIPFVVALQGLSPQVKPVKNGGIEGAEIGMLCNSVTSELSESVRFIPALAQRLFVEWVPRDSGGGFVGSHALDSAMVIKAKKDRAARELETEKKEFGPFKVGDNELIETQYLYCVEVDDDNEPTGGFFCLSFTSTKLSAWRKWNTAIHSLRVPGPNNSRVQPPMYAHVVKLTTVEQKNKHGEFYNFVMSPANKHMKESLVTLQSNGLVAAKGLADMIASGAAKANEASASAGDGDKAGHPDDDGPDAF